MACGMSTGDESPGGGGAQGRVGLMREGGRRSGGSGKPDTGGYNLLRGFGSVLRRQRAGTLVRSDLFLLRGCGHNP